MAPGRGAAVDGGGRSAARHHARPRRGGADGPETGPRVGSCVAAPRAGTLVATAPGPPGTRDALLFLDRQPPHAERARLPIDGAVRALAARAAGARSRVVAAVEGEGGSTTLLALEIGWP